MGSERSTADIDAPAMTLAEWAERDEDAPGELVDGQIVEEEDTRFGVSQTRGRKPDLYVYLPGRKPPRQGLVTVPPDIMVEIVSPRPKDARRDRIEKMHEYAAFGVKFYWIVDPAIRTFDILELAAGGRYAHAVAASEGTIDGVPGCEGLRLDLDALWAEVDRLAPEEASGAS